MFRRASRRAGGISRRPPKHAYPPFGSSASKIQRSLAQGALDLSSKLDQRRHLRSPIREESAV